jgi:flagellar hook assembly protein FlgD
MTLTLTRDAVTEVAIYDALGRRISTPLEGVLAAGRHEIAWDGRDVRGARARAGVYFASARCEGAIRTQRIVLVD